MAKMDDQDDWDDFLGVFRPDSGRRTPDWASTDSYPRMGNFSARFMYRAVLRAEVPEPPEYVTVRIPRRDRIDLELAVVHWNLLWEAAQFRRRLFDPKELPGPLRRIAERGDINVLFVARTRSRYHEYAPLFHLLPRDVVERHGLPLLRTSHWPYLMETGITDAILPADFTARLSNAWASAVWKHLIPGSPMRGFSPADPIRILSHNLDFWLPAVTDVMLDILRDLPVVDEDEPIVERAPTFEDGSTVEGAVVATPRMGSQLWYGEEDSAEVLARTVERADSTGQLRGILDAVRSHRVEDDFSQHWTYAREDFERKLYRKRSKVRVRFVELADTIPVQGPETEVLGQTVFADFLALLDERDRQIVIVLNSGVTKLTEAADILGYRNHSAVSKRLKRIRQQAARFFDAQ